MSDEKQEEAGRAAQRALRVMGFAAQAGAVKARGYVSGKASEVRRSYAPISADNWYLQAAGACESAGDAILRRKAGTSERVVRMAGGKLGAIGVPAAIFSTAALVGTASTGTAIGSLSGAAFTSAALAWIGGSVAAGSVILGVATLAGGIGALFGAGWVAKKFVFGRNRDKTDLDEREQRIVDASLALALAFRAQDKAGRKLDPVVGQALYSDALRPLCDELLEQRLAASSWPYMARRKLGSAFTQVQNITGFAANFSRRRPNLTTGIVGAVLTKLLADDIPAFDANEQLVLDALRRVNNSLAGASDEELAAYVQALDPAQLQGLSNLLIGVSHELRYYIEENSNGDEYVVELFDAVNHPGADVRITNTLTGNVEDAQLKATNYLSYIDRHNERYAGISLLATEEIAAAHGLESSGIPYEDLADDVDSVVSGLDAYDDPAVLASMSVAAMITLARNVKVLLKGKGMSDEDRRALVGDGAKSALVAGLVHTVIG